MRVYVVMSGENGQGGVIEGVFETHDGASERVTAFIQENSYMGHWTWVYRDRWDCDGDWLTIIERVVL